MKKLLLFLILLNHCASSIDAQNWFQSDYRWITHVSGGFAGFDYNFELYFEADTTIHGLPCKKWQTATTSTYGVWLGPVFTYADGPKAYVYDEALDSLVKIYDLSLPVGAQVQVPRQFGVFTYQIDSIDQVQAGDFVLKRQRAHYINQNGVPIDWRFDILENIGMVGSPFELTFPTCSFVILSQFDCNSAVDGVDFGFKCFSSNAGSFHPYSSSCVLTDTKTPGEVVFHILPNPANDYFWIWTPMPVSTFRSVDIRDAYGRVLRSWHTAQEQYDISDFPAGVYFVYMGTQDGVSGVKKLVRE